MKFVFTLFVAILFVGIAIVASYFSLSCSDTDLGNLNVRGEVKGINGKFYDQCDSKGNLIDYYCNGNKVDFSKIYCGGKCYEGTCPASCRFTEPTERTIILRLDDVQSRWNIATINLVDVILSKNMSVSLGVIPEGMNDSLLQDYIASKLNDSRISVAQHGTYHVDNEFANLNETASYYLAKIGFDDIRKKLHVQPIVFIPPDGIYNVNTIGAFAKLGFKVLSATDNEYRFDGELIIIGANAITKSSARYELAPTSDILNTCRYFLDLQKVCVILIHPQDYIGGDVISLNQTRYLQFDNLLNQLQSLNSTFSTFNDIVKCT